MNKTQQTSNESILPFVSALLVIILILAVMYYREIAQWLYARELWLIPIQIK